MSAGLTRRGCLRTLTAAGAASALGSAEGAFEALAPARYDGGWIGQGIDRAHAWRDGRLPARAEAGTRRVHVAIVGAGIAGLSAAWHLRAAGIDDLVLLDLEDEAGGNARGHVLGGRPCPLGAHYLPVPDERNAPLLAWLHEVGVARTVAGRVRFDERMLCHAPQERIYVGSARGGAWHEGLLPAAGVDGAASDARLARRTQEQLLRLAGQWQGLARELRFTLPTHRAPWTGGHAALDAQTFAAWLDTQGYDDPALRWYLDYCCRDDYGAGAAAVSAWAGIQYFMSRHGLHADVVPGSGAADADREAVLTWPHGNAFLVQALARHRGQDLGSRCQTGAIVTRIEPGRHEVLLDVVGPAGASANPGPGESRRYRWAARHVVLAVPLFVAARLLARRPAALQAVAPRMVHAPWLVTNLLLGAPLLPRTGAPPAWDNVLHASPALGYVDAAHQSLRSDARRIPPFVLTHYWALGGSGGAELATHRRALLQRPWRDWAGAVLADLARAHPDLPGKVHRVELMRYGHAMAVPVPGLRGHAGLRALTEPQERLHFAHADLSAYSVFEEAFDHGRRAAQAVARAGRG